MTKMLEKAFHIASELPEMEQNLLARWVMDEIESEKQWQTLFSASENALEILANEALTEYVEGKSNDLDINKL